MALHKSGSLFIMPGLESRRDLMLTEKLRVSILFLLLTVFGFPVPASPQTASAPRSRQIRLLENWLLSHRGAESGLPVSHVGDLQLKDWCFTYDAAVVAVALLAVNRSGEAARIVDFYIHAKQAHRLGGIIEAVSVMPPYDGREWSVRAGANLWLGIASYHLYRSAHQKRHLAFAARIADFAIGLQDRRRTRRTYGGIAVGPPGDPANADDQHFDFDARMPGFEQVFSTEATIDAFALFNMLASEPGMARFREARDLCLAWLEKVAWNPVDKRFNRGFHQEPDYSVATDIQAWAVSAMGVSQLDLIESGAAANMIHFVEENCQNTVPYRLPDGRRTTVRGFDFTDRGALAHYKRPPLVSPEWTFQMINAYQRLADDYSAMGASRKAELYSRKREDLLTQLLAVAVIQGDAAGFPYSTLGGAAVGHEHYTPAKGALSMIGTAYGILAIKGSDPLRIPAIPGESTGNVRKD
jgi:hypothetical protein